MNSAEAAPHQMQTLLQHTSKGLDLLIHPVTAALGWNSSEFSTGMIIFTAEIFGFHQKMPSLISKFSVIREMWPVGQDSSCAATVTVGILQCPTSARANPRAGAGHGRAHQQHKHQDKYLFRKISCLCAYFANLR